MRKVNQVRANYRNEGWASVVAVIAVAYPHTVDPRDTKTATQVLNKLFECLIVDMMRMSSDQEPQDFGCKEACFPLESGRGGRGGPYTFPTNTSLQLGSR